MIKQSAKAAEHERHRLVMCEIVAGVDHQIRLESPERGQPALPSPVGRGHMQIRHMQNADIPGPDWQHRYRHPTQPEGIDLVQSGVRQTADANRTDACQPLHDPGRDGTVPRHKHQGYKRDLLPHLIPCLSQRAPSRSDSAPI